MNPILLLHGALGAKNQLDPLAAALRDAGRTVHSMNFSGHGGEPFHPSGFGIEVFAGDVEQFLDRQGIGPCDIFGYSMGGYVAVWLAHLSPERIGRIVTLGTKFDWSVESAEREVKKVNPDIIESKVPAFARILESRHRPNDWRNLLHKTAAMMTALGVAPLLTDEILSSINVPITVCLGDNDDMADRGYSEEVSRILPKGSFILIDSTPHPIERVRVNSLVKIMFDGE